MDVIHLARVAFLAAAIVTGCGVSVRAQIGDSGAVLEPWTPPPNLFPSWLSDDFTPAYAPTTFQVPWTQTPEFSGHGPWTLQSPQHGSFVSCSGAGGPFGALPQNLASSLDGRFGANHLVESPCSAASGLFCWTGFEDPMTPERIATATANAYVALDAFWSFFESLGWLGFDNSGTPINVEFGTVTSLASYGWNAGANSVTFCPGWVLHINHLTHELAHGLVAATADFSYNFSGSGGDGARIINEAYADFFAEMIEFDAALPDTSLNPNSPGDYIVVTGKSDPGISGGFYAPSKPCYTGPVSGVSQAGWYSEGGPIRHAMYLLTEGTDPADLPHSDVCQGPTAFPGIGRQRTAQIWLDALVECDWRKDGKAIDLCDARRCTIAASSCPDLNAVVRAWNAVSLTAPACGTLDRLCAIKAEESTR